ncbi:Crp/Fnr family transcriptional regulator [Candidatus Saccharibacteria bacterium]|nr:Crp/Fnr family transcriptional regulator [Candidatus Saccharibacteria bacterium]
MADVPKDYDEQIRQLFKDARLKYYPKNQIIQYQGDKLSQVYLIVKGYVKNYTILDSGDTRTLFILGPNDVFPVVFTAGNNWHDYEIRYFYQSLTDVQLRVLTADDFMRIIDEDKTKRQAYMSFVSAVNESMVDQLEAMKQKSAIARIVYMLPYLMHKMGQRVGPAAYQLKIKLTHQELADISGVTRETTTTLVKKLEKKGAIKQKQGRLVIYKKLLDKLRDNNH